MHAKTGVATIGIAGALALLVWAATPGARGAVPVVPEPACPDGEITLASDDVRLVRRGGGRDRLLALRGAFVLPDGVALDPAAEAVTLHVAGDGVPLLTLDLPAGVLSARRGGRFVFAVHERGAALRKGSRLVLRRRGRGHRVAADLAGLDLGGLDLASPPLRLKQLVKIGDDCFSAQLVCTAANGRLRCGPERTALLRGRVRDDARRPLPGAMVTAYDDVRRESVSVFVQPDGRFVFPPLRPGTWRVRARLVGKEDQHAVGVALGGRLPTALDFTMPPAADPTFLLPSVHWLRLLLDDWTTPTIRADFTLSCGNCHQIGHWRFRREKTEQQWRTVLTQMMTNLPPYFQATRDVLVDNVLATFGPGAPLPPLPLPPPPAGETLKAVVYEYFLGDDVSRPGCHDLELGTDGVVYADAGVRWIDPRTAERGTWPLNGGAHSIERAPDGNMWITQAAEDALATLDVKTHAFRYFPLPRIGDDQGAYPHTLRFDADGNVWFTLTKSNHVARFDPTTETYTYFRLPEADPAEVGLSIPVAYGCDTAPDGTVWYSQLFGERIGRFDPASGMLVDWRPPFFGPRRLHVGADGIVWVPGFASGVLGRFDPTIERWKVYDLPTGLPGPPGFGTSETPYSLNANRRNGEVWVNGTNSDTLIRFDPVRERFAVFPLPTLNSYTREIEFDADNNVWTCTSATQPEPSVEGRGRFVKLELPPPDAECGNGRREPGEECDDGNPDSCDGCTTACRVETGCGDGAACGSEACDDGNDDDCDGCSAACVLEPGLRCGDGVTNADCGEACDPPLPGTCGVGCTKVPDCGDGVLDPGETCDDGNADGCDGCTTACTDTTGCGDGALCAGEQCDDGNLASCDGCSDVCVPEPGAVCGDGVVNAACGEECDPPGGTCSKFCTVGGSAPLGTRHLSFGGSSYSSALGIGVPLGTLGGAFDLVAGPLDGDGKAPVTVTGPVFYRAAILGGAFGHLCVRIASCTGFVDCDGGSAVDAATVQDSAGPGKQGNPMVVTAGLGADGGPGAVSLACSQAVVQNPPQQPDCTAATYPPDQTMVYTTGTSSGSYLNGDPRIGNGAISLSGETFDCGAWTVEDGPGKLVSTFLMEADPQAGDTANANLLDD
jgi:cysteine-rich repeat protein